MKIKNVEQHEDGTGEITLEYAEQVFKELLAFQGYGFCKAHATSYSVYSAVQMYLQEHFFIEYMCALLNHIDRADEKKDVGVLNERVEYCVKNGVMIKYPNVNTSGSKWKIVGGSLLAPLKNIKGFSDREVNIIESGRPYSGFKDFMKRTGFNENRFFALLYSNSLSDFGTIDDLYNEYKNQFINECSLEKEFEKKKEKLEKDYSRSLDKKRNELEKKSKKELEKIDSEIAKINENALFGDDSGIAGLEARKNEMISENDRIYAEFQESQKKILEEQIRLLKDSSEESHSSGIAYPQTIHDKNDLFDKCMDYNGFVIPDNIKIKYRDFFENGMKYVAEYKKNEEYGRRNSRIYSIAEIKDELPEEDKWKNCWILAKVISEARGIKGKFGTFDKIVISDGKDKETIVSSGIPMAFKKGNVMIFPISMNGKGKIYIDTRTMDRLDPVILE